MNIIVITDDIGISER